MTDKLNYEKDLEININELHKEWLRQPSLYGRYAMEWADANKLLNKLKRELKVTEKEAKKAIDEKFSQLSFEARKGGEDKIGVKPTEASVQSWIISHPDYKSVVEFQESYVEKVAQKFIDAQYDVDLLSEALKSLEQRKTALEQEVYLWGKKYFSGPIGPYDLDQDSDFVDGRIKDKVLEQASDRQRKKMQRRK